MTYSRGSAQHRLGTEVRGTLAARSRVCAPESALTPVDISVDNGGEAGAVPIDALGDTAAGAVASYFQGVT